MKGWFDSQLGIREKASKVSQFSSSLLGECQFDQWACAAAARDGTELGHAAP